MNKSHRQIFLSFLYMSNPLLKPPEPAATIAACGRESHKLMTSDANNQVPISNFMEQPWILPTMHKTFNTSSLVRDLYQTGGQRAAGLLWFTSLVCPAPFTLPVHSSLWLVLMRVQPFKAILFCPPSQASTGVKHILIILPKTQTGHFFASARPAVAGFPETTNSQLQPTRIIISTQLGLDPLHQILKGHCQILASLAEQLRNCGSMMTPQLAYNILPKGLTSSTVSVPDHCWMHLEGKMPDIFTSQF